MLDLRTKQYQTCGGENSQSARLRAIQRLPAGLDRRFWSLEPSNLVAQLVSFS